MSFPKVPLAKVVRDLTNERLVQVDPNEDVVDPTIKCSTHKISVASIQKGVSVKISKRIRIEPNDLVFSRLHTQNGAFAFADRSYLATTTFIPLAIDEKHIDRRFLFWALHVRVPTLSASDTVGRETYKTQDILSLEIPLPSLSEQRRILARIEELGAKIESALSLRLHAIVEGDLLPKNARQAVFNDLKNKYVPLRLDSVVDSRLGKMLSGEAKTGIGSTPYLRNANIQRDRLDLSSIYEMDFNEDEKEKLALQNGDILVCEGGDIGKAAIWNGEIPGCSFQKALHRVRVDRSKLIPRFMLHHIFWAAEQGHFADIKTQTTIAHLTGVKLKAYGVIVPPLPEQFRIVAYLDELQAKADALRRLQAETGAELDALMPAVLDRAFKGELL